jgi:capsular exopolysaccharide synthesis family protein
MSAKLSHTSVDQPGYGQQKGPRDWERSPSNKGIPLGIYEYLVIVKKRWLLVLMCIVVGLGIAGADILSSTRQYSASVQVFVAASTTSADNASNFSQGNTFVEARVQSYVSVVTSPDVTSKVITNLRLQMTDKSLASQISADAPLNKVLINIHVTDPDPVLAAKIANSVGSEFIQAVQGLEASAGTGQKSPVKLTVIHPADTPTAAVSPRKKLIFTIGLLGGLFVGLGLAVARERLDTRIRTAADIVQATNSPILGTIPSDRRAANNAIAVRDDSRSRRSEAFRRLRANLQFVDVDKPPRTIAVTSAIASEGKTSVSLNLATTLTEAGFSVCLVEADLRRPTIAATLGLPAGAGLTSVLVGKAEIDDVLQDVGQGLFVMTSGPMPPNPSELLAAQQTRAVVTQLATRFEYVILDTAPLLPVADGLEVVSMAEAALVVVRSGKSNEDRLQKSIDSIHRVGGVVAGIVLNMAPKQGKRRDYDYYQYTAKEEKQNAPRTQLADGIQHTEAMRRPGPVRHADVDPAETVRVAK